jgi:hypothetical protein
MVTMQGWGRELLLIERVARERRIRRVVLSSSARAVVVVTAVAEAAKEAAAERDTAKCRHRDASHTRPRVVPDMTLTTCQS